MIHAVDHPGQVGSKLKYMDGDSEIAVKRNYRTPIGRSFEDDEKRAAEVDLIIALRKRGMTLKDVGHVH